MVKITGVEPASRASRAGILAGDTLISINDNEISDVLDYRFYLTEKSVTLCLERAGEKFSVTIKKGEYDDIGLEFETPLMDKKHTCRNGCIFCFIDQNPEGMRESIYFKDDDSRLSFIHGNYITLTNMTDKDIERIVKMRFSPINISIHTTNPELRVKMMKNKRAGEVLKYLSVLNDAGISMCGQIVLCRGIDDGEELRKSISDLIKYYPRLTSLAVVPAGLTKHRGGLYPLSDFTKNEAGAVIDLINEYGDLFKEKFGERFVYAADEFYLKAGREIPSADYYEDYPQLENGVGMLRSFADDFSMCLESEAESAGRAGKRCISLATGVAAYSTVSELAGRVMELCPEIKINVYKVINNFYGESVTVSGLLTGKDIYEQLKDKELGELLLVPKNALRAGEETFLCDMTLGELSEKLGVRALPSGEDGYELCLMMLGINSGE